MRIDVISIFPGMIEQFASHSLLGKARRDGAFELRVLDLRSVPSTRTVPWTTRPSAAAPAWCWRPSPSSRPSSRPRWRDR